jgi:hypothetical protein
MLTMHGIKISYPLSRKLTKAALITSPDATRADFEKAATAFSSVWNSVRIDHGRGARALWTKRHQRRHADGPHQGLCPRRPAHVHRRHEFGTLLKGVSDRERRREKGTGPGTIAGSWLGQNGFSSRRA